MNRIRLVGGVVLAGSSLFLMPSFGAIDTSGYVSLTASDTTDAASQSFNHAGKWSVAPGEETAKAPMSGCKYYVPANMTLYSANTSTDEVTFQGDELLVDGTYWILNTTAGVSITPNLVLRGGAKINYSANKSVIRGTAHIVETTRAKPAYLFWNVANASAASEVDLDFDLPADQYMTAWYGNSKVESYTNAYLAVNGDLSKCLGTVMVRKNAKLFMQNHMPGTVEVDTFASVDTAWKHWASCSCHASSPAGQDTMYTGDMSIENLILKDGGSAIVQKSNKMTVGNLTVQPGGQLVVAFDDSSCGYLSVEKSLSFEGKIPVALKAASVPYQANLTVLRLSPSVEQPLSADDFDIQIDGNNGVIVHCEVLDDETTGGRKVVARINCISQIRTGGSDETTEEPYNMASNAAKTAAFWSDGRAPHAGADYLVPSDITFVSPLNVLERFAGDSLTVKGSIMTGNQVRPGVDVASLHLMNGAIVQVWGGVTLGTSYGLATYRLCGGTCRVSGTVTLRPYGDKLLRVDSELLGDGTIKATGYEISASGKGNVELTGLNTNFTGSVLVTMATNAGKGNPSETVFTTLYVRDGRNLGGPLPAFRADALKVDQMSRIKAVGDVSLDQANRGVTLSGLVRVDVDAGKTLAIRNPLTFGGTVRNEGAGTLALGGRLMFADGAPAADRNVVLLKSGAFKAESTNACDGLAFVIASDVAKFVYDVAPTGDGVKEFGVYDVAWATPVAFQNGASKINVAFADAEKLDGRDVTLGFFTVATKALADDIRSRMTVSHPRGYRVDLSVKQNALGSWTIGGTLSKNGLMLIVR